MCQDLEYAGQNSVCLFVCVCANILSMKVRNNDFGVVNNNFNNVDSSVFENIEAGEQCEVP